MKTQAWLVLELRSKERYGGRYDTLHVKGVRKTRPNGEIAVEIKLDVPNEIIYPKVEAKVEYDNQVSLELGEEE